MRSIGVMARYVFVANGPVSVTGLASRLQPSCKIVIKYSRKFPNKVHIFKKFATIVMHVFRARVGSIEEDRFIGSPFSPYVLYFDTSVIHNIVCIPPV